ncbi:hypothetical protein HHK36_006864 [Tetracentron sinense]|uniref:Uncharacterized protein n=1 Tax=Tetracentron sinense TaxID=13715 RepID=A0A834Y6A9_TETSI|nr:hypothetical protein HHK36_031923 [Tetracentron sinense]KAF8407729.1 hypothetical protein HHK36_006864 [Tetracentron sinense]
MMLTSGITTLIHILVCWILVLKFCPTCTKTWTGFSKDALHDVLNFIKLAIPSAVMVCLETWSFEMMVLFSGLLPNPKLETSVLSPFNQIPFGLSSTVRISNELGAERPARLNYDLGS